jgi:hypothetical protein
VCCANEEVSALVQRTDFSWLRSDYNKLNRMLNEQASSFRLPPENLKECLFEVKDGHDLSVNSGGSLKSGKFDKKTYEDDLYNWSSLRSEYLAEANSDAAQIYVAGGNSWSGTGWYWDPWYDAYTFIPGDGFLYDPFGWGFYSPGFVSRSPFFFVGHFHHHFDHDFHGGGLHHRGFDHGGGFHNGGFDPRGGAGNGGGGFHHGGGVGNGGGGFHHGGGVETAVVAFIMLAALETPAAASTVAVAGEAVATNALVSGGASKCGAQMRPAFWSLNPGSTLPHLRIPSSKEAETDFDITLRLLFFEFAT